MRRLGIPALCVALAACPAPTPDPPEPEPCPEGQRRGSSGGCEDVLPGDCPAGLRPEVGSDVCRPVGWTDCGAGFARAASGWGCLDVQAEADCPDGTLPALGRTDCVPVGWTTCPAGFSLAGSPSGCEPVLPAVKCEGATREVIGSGTCQPIGDCAAAFPPAEATLFVDPTFAQVDATHFRTVRDALVAAASGATIAVESGTYTENLSFTRPVTLVGRCPERVHLTPGDPLQAGLVADGVRDVRVSGFEVSGFLGGAVARTGGSLELTDVLLRNNAATGAAAIGVGPASQPSFLKLTRSAVRDLRLDQGAGYGLAALRGGSLEASETAVSAAYEAAAAVSDGSAVGSKSAMHLRRAVLRDSIPVSGPAYGGYVVNGGTLALEESAVLRTQLSALLATGAGSHLTAGSTFVADSRMRAGGLYGSAAQAQNGATVELSQCSMRNLAGGAMQAVGAGATLKATRVTARGDATLRLGPSCCGAWAYRGGAVELAGVALFDLPSVGLNAVGAGSTLRATSTLVRGTQPVGNPPFGGLGAGAEQGAFAVIEASALLDNASSALAATTQAEVVVRGSVLRGGATAKNGVVASNGAVVTLVGSVIAGSYEGGVIVLGPDAPASTSPVAARVSLTRCLVRDSRVNLAGQGGWGVAALGGAQLELHDSGLLRNISTALSAIGVGTHVLLERTVLAETRTDGTGHFGVGLNLSDGATAAVHESALVENRVAGVNLEDGSPNRLTLVDSVIAATHRNGELYGHGIVIGSGGAADIRGTAIGASEAIGLAVSGGAATLRRSILMDNPVALHVQSGTTLEEVEATPDTPADGKLLVSTDTVLLRNATRVGSGSVPLPAPIPRP
ncbi:MAG: right-handed parallel beta-helix repeat-containing protein [Myxococcaceae bacterium]